MIEQSEPSRFYLLMLRTTNVWFESNIEFEGKQFEVYQMTKADSFNHATKMVTDSLNAESVKLLKSGELKFFVKQEFQFEDVLSPIIITPAILPQSMVMS